MAAAVVLRALEHVWSSLAPLKVPMAVSGGLALAVWQHVRATRDVDLLLGVSEKQFAKIQKALTGAGIKPKHKASPVRLGNLQVLQFQYEPPGAFLDIQVDLLLSDSSYHQAALARRVEVKLSSLAGKVFVLACEDLIIQKLLAGRAIDKADVTALLRANRDTLDMNYLRQWGKELGLERELAIAWEAAFPGV
jgi:hypothetical protein